MTENEWLTGIAPAPMLDFLYGRASNRQLRLLAVCFYRLIWHWVTDRSSRRAVEVAERFADRRAGRAELADAYRTAYTTYLNSFDDSIFAYVAAHEHAGHAARIAARDVEAVQGVGELATLIRDVIANPFRTLPPVEPSWLTPTVVAIARRSYEERDFGALPILADALEDAGCEAEEILAHCRQQKEHTRGCWIIDQLLGRH